MLNTLPKTERLCSKLIVDKMFAGGASRSFSVYPLRIVFMETDKKETPISILISVPKKRFKHAVKRNYVKRQIREGYRKNKEALHDMLQTKEHGLAIAFIYLSDEFIPTQDVEAKIKIMLARIIEKSV